MLRDTPQTIYLKDYRPPAFLIEQVELEFELGEEETLVRSTLALRRNPDSPDRPDDLLLDGEGLELLRLELDAVQLGPDDYRLEKAGLRVLAVPDCFELFSEVRIHPERNTALEGLYRSGGKFCTQCEAEGFRRITWFLDRPDVMARFTTHIIADAASYPVLLSNGNPLGEENLDGGRKRVSWQDPFPKPCYLFALVAGDLRCVEGRHTTPSGREVALKFYVEPENIDKCDHALASLQNAMSWDERVYGREYDLDLYMVVAVNDFNMGAMENKGLNIFNSKYVLARPDTATDRDFQGIEGVIAHEYFHNWTGNRITCRDWFQLSLKEGLTVFRDQEFSADMGSRGVKRIEDVRMLRAHQFAEDAGPMAHPVRPDSYIEINNFYTLTVYEKGAELVRMQALLLGPENYRKATDLYFARHDGQAVTIEDFVACMEQAGGRDLSQFRLWYSQAGTPRVRVKSHWDGVSGTYRLSFSQSCPGTPGQPDKQPLHIPFQLGLLDSEGNDLPLRLEGEAAGVAGSRLLELRQPEEVFEFVGLSSEPVPSLLRGFSAPVIVEYDYSDEQLMFLMAHDSDGFTRWDAAQSLLQRVILRRVEDPASALPQGLVSAVRQALNEGGATSGADLQLLAEVLTLPSESYLGDQVEQIDVDAIHQARQWLKQQLGQALLSEFSVIYQQLADRAPYQPTPQAMGRRALRNLALDYLTQADRKQLDLAVRQYHEANNMTDSLAALSLVVDSDPEMAAALLEAFYQRWHQDPLVLDKWFSVQAQSSHPDTLERVKALMRHPDFTLTNPNRVRSLLSVFATANPVRFHRIDGAGYRLLCDTVLELDALNPQIASRLLRSLSRWRRYDATRRELMQQQLQRVLDRSELSRDLFEVAGKLLDA